MSSNKNDNKESWNTKMNERPNVILKSALSALATVAVLAVLVVFFDTGDDEGGAQVQRYSVNQTNHN